MPSNDELFKRYIRDGSPELLGEIYHRFWKVICQFCRGHLHNLGDAEDAAQSTFLVLPTRVQTLTAGNLQAYLFKCARYAISDIERIRYAHVSLDEGLEKVTKSLPQHEKSPDGAEPDPRLKELWAIVDELSDSYREVLTLRYGEGIGATELSARLEITVGALHQRLTRARRSLSKKLTAAGIPNARASDSPTDASALK